jgi:uncharacterized glyoxalase superfamily protein PhnB
VALPADVRWCAKSSQGESCDEAAYYADHAGRGRSSQSLAFYREGLGLGSKRIVGAEFEHGTVAFFDLEGGIKLALWPRKSLSHDCGVPTQKPSATEFSIAHNVDSKTEVDAVMEQARKAGAKIVKPARDTVWGGYAGYFQDPDDHLWEVAYNPQWSASSSE